MTKPETEKLLDAAHSRLVTALAAIVNVHTPDELYDLNAIPRDPVMLQVQRIRDAARDMLAALRAQGGGEEMSPEFTDTSRAALAWVLYHHQGGSSPVGQPIRFALGMGQHERLNDYQLREAKRWAALSGATTADFHTSVTTPDAAPDAGTLKVLIDQLELDGHMDKTAHGELLAAIAHARSAGGEG